MNYCESGAASCVTGSGPIDLVIKTRETAFGSINHRRIMPVEARASIGPFVLLDHFGPVKLPPGASIDIAAPSETGFVGLTYLFDGEIILSDRSGSRRVIQSRAMSLLSSGPETNQVQYSFSSTGGSPNLHGIHSWISVPPDESDCTPAIEYYPAEKIPKVRLGDITVIVVLGEIYGKGSPVTRHGSTLFLICDLPEMSEYTLPGTYLESGVYVISGCLEIDGHSYLEGTMAVAALGWPIKLRAKLSSSVLIIGTRKIG